VHFAESLRITALGTSAERVKHPLSVLEGSMENATSAQVLLVDLRERGLEVGKPVLVITDESKALRWAVLEVFSHPVIRRQHHKIVNVEDRLPAKVEREVERWRRAAFRSASEVEAEGQSLALAQKLENTHPGAAVGFWEGLPETPTVISPALPPVLRRTMRRANPIESRISICREHPAKVKYWQNGQMALRWCAAGMSEAEKQIRPVNPSAPAASSSGPGTRDPSLGGRPGVL
jgi:putative transposase